MTVVRTLTRWAMIATMLVMALPGGQASAQFLEDRRDEEEATAGSYMSEISGLEITFTDDWEITDSEVYPGPPEEELLQIESDSGALMLAFSGMEDAEESRDLLLDEFTAGFEEMEVVDEDVSRGFAWSLVNADGATIYVEVEDGYVDDLQLVTIVMASEGDFLGHYELVQDTVQVDGDSVLNEHDAGDLEDLLGAGATTTTTTRGGREEEPEEEATQESTGSTRTGERGSATGNDRETGQERGGSEAGDEYLFESEDLEVAVRGDLSIDSSQVEPGSYEQILLVGTGSIGAVSLVTNELAGPETLEGFMTGFTGEMDGAEEIDSGVDNGFAWTLYTADLGGTEMYVYATVQEDRFADWHLLELVAIPTSMFEDEFVSFQESVEIDGDPMFVDSNVDDLIDILDSVQ